MGLFSGTFGRVKYFQKLAVAVGNVIVLIDEYDRDHDLDNLLIAAWLCKAGIEESVVKGAMLPNHQINVMVSHRLVKMTVQDALTRSMGRLSMVAKELNEHDSHMLIDIVNGGAEFVDIDSDLSQELKDKLLKLNLNL